MEGGGGERGGEGGNEYGEGKVEDEEEEEDKDKEEKVGEEKEGEDEEEKEKKKVEDEEAGEEKVDEENKRKRRRRSGGGDLKRQQALVDLGSLQAGLAVGAGRVRPPLIARQVDERELPVHLPPPPQDDLEDGVAPGGVGVGRRLPRGPGRRRGGDDERRRAATGTPGLALQPLLTCSCFPLR